MHRIRLLFFLLLVSCIFAILSFKIAPPPLAPISLEVASNRLELRDGRLVRRGSKSPFNGFVFERYADGKLKSRAMVAAGLLHGISEGWHTNGVLQVREHFENGISHGLREKWFSSGVLQSHAEIFNGKLEGMFYQWSPQGNLADTIEMKQGIPQGIARSFYPGGSVKVEARIEGGKPVAHNTFTEGEFYIAISSETISQ
jgi:antitoxin component YwqK of YwqJK toxin-antitoxin module